MIGCVHQTRPKKGTRHSATCLHSLIDHHICHGVRPLGCHVKNGSLSSSSMNCMSMDRKGEEEYGRKGKFWVWSGREMEWCIVKVAMMMMMMMMNWWESKMRWQWQGLIINRLAKFFRKFIPQARWRMAETAVVDFQRGIERWTSKADSIRGTSAAIGVEDR